MAGVRLQGLTKLFASTRAVDAIDLTVPDGEFVVLVGPSGCGKTTTLNMVAGLETPTAGDIFIGDARVTDWEPRDRNLGMVFQSLALFPHFSVFDNIAFPLRIKKISEAEVRARVEAVAATTRIAPLLGKRPATLSGGEAQRVALMDEPLSSLDAKLRVEMRTELKRLHAQLSATFVYVTHDQAEAMTMADRIVVMHQGRIQQVGPPLEIYADPANRFVAGFFGVPAMNFLDGEVVADGNALRFRTTGLRPALTAPRTATRGPATLGVRPEHVRLGDGADASPATVSLIEPMGDETLVFLDYGGPGSLVAKVDAEEKVAVGDRRPFTLRPDKLSFFDSGGGRLR